MGEIKYKGRGALTMHPQTKAFMGFWADNFRGMYTGSGKREGDKLMMTWEGYQGTYKQELTRTGDDSYTYTFSFTDPAGNVSGGKGEMTRVKETSKK